MAGIGIDMRIRRMTEADIEAVSNLEVQIYPEPWSVGVFHDEFGQANRIYYVAEGNSGIGGYGGVMVLEQDAHITTLAVSPAARKQGLGKRMMLELVDAALDAGAKHLTLEVRVSNLPARDLYQRFGFAPVGVRKNYYATEDALVMWAIDIDVPEYRDRLAAIREEVA